MLKLFKHNERIDINEVCLESLKPSVESLSSYQICFRCQQKTVTDLTCFSEKKRRKQKSALL